MGIKALQSHYTFDKHKAVIKCQQQELSISHFGFTSGAGVSRPSLLQLHSTSRQCLGQHRPYKQRFTQYLSTSHIDSDVPRFRNSKIV